jgi:hypothetical protein
MAHILELQMKVDMASIMGKLRAAPVTHPRCVTPPAPPVTMAMAVMGTAVTTIRQKTGRYNPAQFFCEARL